MKQVTKTNMAAIRESRTTIANAPSMPAATCLYLDERANPIKKPILSKKATHPRELPIWDVCSKLNWSGELLRKLTKYWARQTGRLKKNQPKNPSQNFRSLYQRGPFASGFFCGTAFFFFTFETARRWLFFEIWCFGNRNRFPKPPKCRGRRIVGRSTRARTPGYFARIRPRSGRLRNRPAPI